MTTASGVARSGGRARNGDYEIEYEVFGDPSDPVVLFVSGLGSQMLAYRPAFCERVVAAGFCAVRFDNRDVGLSTKTPGAPPAMDTLRDRLRSGESLDPPYTVTEMAADGMAVLDDIGCERAHVWGMSMGGMIVQHMAMSFPHRVRTLTSVMSSTGDPATFRPRADVAALLVAPRPPDREGAMEMDMEERRLEAGDWFDEVEVRAYLDAQYDRCHHPDGQAFQYVAVVADGDRTERLASITVPTTVLHGGADPLITPPAGEATAAAIPGAQFVLVPGMGHHVPPEVWDVVIHELVELAGRE